MNLRNGKVIASSKCSRSCQLTTNRCCCACADKRPHEATYIAYNNPNLQEVSFVKRNHYYCPGCKNIQPLKIDLSKLKNKPVSAPFVFPKSNEQKLLEAEAEIAALKDKLVKQEKQHSTDLKIIATSWKQEVQRVRDLRN